MKPFSADQVSRNELLHRLLGKRIQEEGWLFYCTWSVFFFSAVFLVWHRGVFIRHAETLSQVRDAVLSMALSVGSAVFSLSYMLHTFTDRYLRQRFGTMRVAPNELPPAMYKLIFTWIGDPSSTADFLFDLGAKLEELGHSETAVACLRAAMERSRSPYRGTQESLLRSTSN